VPTILSGISNGQLLVTDNSAVDAVTLDHSGSFTFVNGAAFPDSQITNGILIRVGTGVGNLDTVNIRATVKPVTVDGQDDVGTVNLGKNGSVQGIQAPVSLTNLAPGFSFSGQTYDLSLDDSTDTIGRNVTLNAVNGTGTLSGLAPATISFSEVGLGAFTVKGGSGGNTFTVLNTPADLEIFGLSFTVTDLETGVGNDTVSVLGTTSTLQIDGQVGRDTVRVGNGGNLQGIQGQVSIFNTGDFTSLTVDGSAATSPQNVTMSVANGTGTIDGLAPARIT
jgi:hypothetical protein